MSGAIERIVEAAIDSNDSRLLHAAVRAGLPVPAQAAPLLTATVPTLNVTSAAAHDRTVTAVNDQYAPIADSDTPPLTPWTRYHRRVLAVVLALTTENGTPYPGVPAPVAEVVRVAVGGTGSATHAQKALHVLEGHQLVSIDAGLVQPGPVLALWDRDDDLAAALDRIDR